MPRTIKQPSLFDAPQERSLTVTEALAQVKPQDKQQAAFHRLIKQIHKLRAEIEEWQAYQVRYNQSISTKLMPLLADARKKRIAMAHLLDEQFHRKNAIRSKRLRAKLQAMIVELTRDLLLEGHDEAIVALHDRHSNLTHEEGIDLEKTVSQDLFQKIFGVEMDADSADDVHASVEEMIFKAQQKEAQAKEARAAKRASKKTAKAAAAEEKRAAAEKEVSQTVRDVYRKLASALHPDRTGGDLTAARKTELMQRVNKAYDQGNLLELLNIQLEIEQINADHLTNLPSERMAHYIQVLREQVAELQSERRSLIAPFQSLMPYTQNLTPGHVDLSIDAEVARVKRSLQHLESDLAAFVDPEILAQALKSYEPEDEFDPFEVLSNLLDNMGVPPGPGAPAPPRQRRRRKA